MNSDQARVYFEYSELTYAKLNRFTIDLLANMIQTEIMKQRIEIPDTALLNVEPPKYTAKQLKTGTFSGFELTVSGTYFSKREAITFNENGFIGFAGWASGYHKEPFTVGFIKWCDAISAKEDA